MAKFMVLVHLTYTTIYERALEVEALDEAACLEQVETTIADDSDENDYVEIDGYGTTASIVSVEEMP